MPSAWPTPFAQLVLQAAVLAEGGDLFLLDMGEPVRIIDLARQMIQLSGLTLRDEHNPDGDIAIECTSLRPGEKLYEELLIEADSEPDVTPSSTAPAKPPCRPKSYCPSWMRWRLL